jgi:1,4-alpha-glucan branching enzyme
MEYGWMNDTLKYGEMEPYFKGFNHGLINFSMIYAFTENFILPFSTMKLFMVKNP